MVKKYIQGLFSAFLLFLIFTGSAQAGKEILKVRTDTSFVFVSVPTDVTITVTDMRTGAPIDGASVNLSGAGFIGNGTTVADGTVVISVHATSAALSPLGFATIIVTASQSGFINGTTNMIVLERSLIATANPRNIVSGRSTDITINVTTPNFTTHTFEPVPEANISLNGDGVNKTGITNDNGTAVIPVNPDGPGIINVTANKTDFLNGTATILVDPLLINATPAGVLVSTPVDITFNVTDATGMPVDGVYITLTGAGVSGSNTTGANGTATIDVHATEAGTISVTANKTGYLNGSASITASVPPLLVVGIPVLVKVSAPTNVTFLVSTPNITTGLTSPVPNANVTLIGAGVNESNTTDANGTVVMSVHALTAGRIIVTANKTNFADGMSFLLAMSDRLLVSGSPMMVSVGVPKPVTFTVTSNGMPQANASVNLSQGGMEIANGTTGASGRVTITVNASATGLVNVVASKEFFINGTTILMATSFGVSQRLTVVPDTRSVKVSIPQNVTFTVTSNGLPVPDASVNLNGAGVSAANTTDASGTTVISVHALSPGLVRVVASKARYNNGNANLFAQK